ncbi:MAG: MerR family DNA-binding protein [Crocinitomicaceae bacterium]|nr:MerR family DNA-binding protein [Crocinitomicaceae bacterium]
MRFLRKAKVNLQRQSKAKFNNYKDYSEETLRRLLSIKKIKNFGFTLNEVSDLLDMIDVNEATCNNVESKIEDKIKLLDEKIRELIAIRNQLLEGVKKCAGSCDPERPEDNCPIIAT